MKTEDIVNPKSTYNLAKGILRFSDYRKLMKMTNGDSNPAPDPNTKIAGEDPTEMGNTLDNGDQDQLRRRKDDYQSESIESMVSSRVRTLAAEHLLKIEGTIQPNGTDKVCADDSIANNTSMTGAAIKKRLKTEDIDTADYKVNPTTGRRYRAHRVDFKNSSVKNQLDDDPENSKTDSNTIKPTKPLLKKVGT